MVASVQNTCRFYSCANWVEVQQNNYLHSIYIVLYNNLEMISSAQEDINGLFADNPFIGIQYYAIFMRIECL